MKRPHEAASPESSLGLSEEVRCHEANPRSIKHHVARFLRAEGDRFRGRRVLDLPAGNGLTSLRLLEAGAEPVPLDLFPESFQLEGIECGSADISRGLPLPDAAVDDAFCQEGIEHFPDAFHALCEFNRVLRPGGSLFLTTPNASNLGARWSHLLAESERSGSLPPPNELDSVWFADGGEAFYFGHVFLIGALRLRALARLAGFTWARHLPTRARTGSVALAPLFYPAILLSNALTRAKNKRKHPGDAARHAVYDELFRLGTDWRILTHSHLFVELRKEREVGEVAASLTGRGEGLGVT